MMDSLHAAYLEETEELLQKAEECLIRLENGRSGEDIHELFRIFHSIKGSSQMIGYDDIGSLTHKMEDMLDIVRKGLIDLDGQVLQLCFNGLDLVKQLFESKKNLGGDRREDFVHAAGIWEGQIDQILGARTPTQQGRKDAPRGYGVVGALKETERTGQNRYYIRVFFSDDVPMIAPVLFMIFNNLKEIGSLVYSDVSDEDLYEASKVAKISSLTLILDSELEEAELYAYLDVTYVEKIVVADISERRMLKQAMPFERDSRRFFELFFQACPKLNPVLFHDPNASGQAEFAGFVREWRRNLAAEADRLQGNPIVQRLMREIATFCDLCLNASEGERGPGGTAAEHLRQKYLALFETAYVHVKGKFYYKFFKAKNSLFMENLLDFAERMDKSGTRILLLDLSRLEMMDEQALNRLIALKRHLNGMGIAVRVMIGHLMRRRLINIFDAIRTIEPFDWFDSELGAALGENTTFPLNDRARCGGLRDERIQHHDCGS